MDAQYVICTSALVRIWWTYKRNTAWYFMETFWWHKRPPPLQLKLWRLYGGYPFLIGRPSLMTSTVEYMPFKHIVKLRERCFHVFDRFQVSCIGLFLLHFLLSQSTTDVLLCDGSRACCMVFLQNLGDYWNRPHFGLLRPTHHPFECVVKLRGRCLHIYGRVRSSCISPFLLPFLLSQSTIDVLLCCGSGDCYKVLLKNLGDSGEIDLVWAFFVILTARLTIMSRNIRWLDHM